jgi:hypothetical protein
VTVKVWHWLAMAGLQLATVVFAAVRHDIAAVVLFSLGLALAAFLAGVRLMTEDPS